MRVIPYSRQSIDDSDISSVVDVLKSDLITQGSKTEQFELAITKYCDCKYAVVFNSGTSALHASYFASGLSQDDEFITSPITFAATANAGLYLGAKPVFVDVEPDTANIDTSKIKEKITTKTKLIVPVHYAGHPVYLERIYAIAKKYNLYVIEDACHALGAKYKGDKIGSCKYSDMTVFSFHPVKSITTGEGGAVLTNNREYYDKLLMFRTHGITKDKSKFAGNKTIGDWYYEMQLLGYNYRMTDFQAALGISQLKRLNSFIVNRNEVAKFYDIEFRDNPFFYLPTNKDYTYSSYHLYPIRIKKSYFEHKYNIFKTLKNSGICVQVHYIPVYYHPFYQNLGYKLGICPMAEEFYESELSLPIYPDLSKYDLNFVVKTVLMAFESLTNYD